MTPYAELTYFVLIGVLLLPLVLAGRRRGADGRWIIVATTVVLLVQYSNRIPINAHNHWPELVPLIAFGAYEWGLLRLALAKKLPGKSMLAIPLALLPLMVAKWLPLVAPDSKFGFAGISYVTFRALDILWAVTDGALKEVAFLDFGIFLFFFPTISAGPIDRFRRFKPEWRQCRTKEQFWEDFDVGLPAFFRGLLYKFVLATVIERYWLESTRITPGIGGAVAYAYIYSLYLFFDFAGYSAFAIGVSRWFGIRSPENFNMPFAAQNIRDFWNRWHMSLSFWFRDHVYTRFLLSAVRGKWFKKRETASNLGYFVSFGLMGLWHGIETYYLLYGLYQAMLMAGFDVFTRWKKRHNLLLQGRFWKGAAHLLTLHCVVFGLWLFSGQAWQGKVPAGEWLSFVGQQNKVGWRGYYRNSLPAPTTDRVRVAFTMGGLMADAYLAMEAGDNQAFKALQLDILKYAAPLGLADALNDPVHDAARMADLESWDSARRQMAANEALIQKLLTRDQQPDLALLVDLGLWSRMLEVTSSMLFEYPMIKNKIPGVGSIAILKDLNEKFSHLSPGVRTVEPAVILGDALAYLQIQWTDKGPSPTMAELTRDKLRFAINQMTPAAAPSTPPPAVKGP